MPDPQSPNPGADMLRMHHAITRSLDVSIEKAQASGLQPKVRQGYQTYLRALADTLNAHHVAEDEIVFPYWQGIEPQVPVDELTNHHRLIIPLLDRINTWVEAGDYAWEPDSISHLLSALNALDSVWRPHIALEEAYFSPLTCERMLKPDEKARFAGEIAAQSQKHIHSPEITVPFVLYNLSQQDRAQFVKVLPPQISEQLIPFVWKPAWSPMQPFLLD